MNDFMMAAFNDELEKIALSKKLLMRASEESSRRGRQLGRSWDQMLGRGGFDGTGVYRTKLRREAQASSFLQAAATGTSPKVRHAISASDAKNTEKMIRSPQFARLMTRPKAK